MLKVKNLLLSPSSRSLSTTTTALRPLLGPSYYHHVGKHPLVYRTVGQQLRLTTDKFPNNEALVSCHEDERMTFSDVLEKVDRLAAGFHHIGLSKGDRIGILSPNSSLYYLSVLAAARAGLISVGINPAYQVPELEYCLKKVGIKAIVAPESYKTQNYYQMLNEIIPELSTSKAGEIDSHKMPSLSAVIIGSSKRLPGTLQFEEVLNLGTSKEIFNVEGLQSTIQPDSGLTLMFSSGTTGQPKAALLSHFGFVNNALHIGLRHDLNRKFRRICLQVPFFHVYGAVVGLTSLLCYGSTLVVPGPGFNAAASIKAIQSEKCSIVYGTPTMYVELISTLKRTKEKTPTLEVAFTGGAACSPKLCLDMKDSLGVKQVKAAYGMTECTGVTLQLKLDDTTERSLDSVGCLTDHMEAKIVDTAGNVVPFGQPGELCIRGYGTMLGYWNDEEKTKETITSDRWLKTGDQFILREDGYGQIVGRLKEMIIRGGENLFPKEIEDVLNTHPSIMEAHCIGVPDERMGEEVCAFVRLLDASHELTQDDLKTYCKEKIAHFKIPKHLRIVDDFPKTTSGKIQKFKLLQSFVE